MKSIFQQSNPTATPGCFKEDCACCEGGRGKGGQCHKNNVNYVVKCKLCPPEDEAVYIGETARNLYTRMWTKGEGFMKKHMAEFHEGEEEDFEPMVVKANKHCLSRQVREGVQIRRFGSHRRLMNTKSEWYQPPLYRVQNEIGIRLSKY